MTPWKKERKLLCLLISAEGSNLMFPNTCGKTVNVIARSNCYSDFYSDFLFRFFIQIFYSDFLFRCFTQIFNSDF